MADFIIQGATLASIADSIRAKTGSTDPIKVSEMAAQIEGITGGGGGGSVEGYATVTFMNGADVLFSRMVLKGDDCPDPYVQGRIELPTKESTVQYDYTFNGWATADGGSADSNALKGITEDKTLYAAFAESARMYTVRFYDGDTLLHTERVAYGGSSSYEYSKSGYAFNGWTPTPTNITTNMDCYGEWVESLEIADSWDEIIAAVNDGTYASKYTVGQYKPLDLGDEGVVNMQIVAFDTDKYDSSNTVATTWIAKELLKNKRAYHSTATAVLFIDTTLYAWLNETLKLAMPSCVQSAIKTVLKQYRYASSASNISFRGSGVAVWLPSMQELNFTGSADANTSDNCYSAVYTDDASRIKCINGTENPAEYMSRSDQSNTWNRGVSASGSYGNASKTTARGVCIGFCI